MITILALVLVLVAIAVVGLPLLESSEEEQVDGVSPELAEALLERDSVFAAMSELESDYGMGNLSKEDYQQLKASYEEKALVILPRLDRLQQEVTQEAQLRFDAEIEREVIEIRRGRSAESPVTGEVCPNCDNELDPDDKYCAFCGAARGEGDE